MKAYTKKLLSVFVAGTLAAGAMLASSLTASAAEDISDYTAADVCSAMGIGWNLGNSLDATGSSGLYTETSWGNPKTTKAMIDAVKAKGFTCVRIPVTWSGHMDSNYTVDEAWFERVQEVVDYCIDDGLYVILNSHHDEWNKPTDDNYADAKEELTVLWTQIAERFENYDKHLVFEGMNEPRNYGGDNEWNGGTDSMREVVNKLNADFVSAVRATGGNNADRALMIPSYAASMEYAAMSALELPDDDNLIVSIHAYCPYNFTMNTDTSTGAVTEFNTAMETELAGVFNNISNLFISKGIPVCIGEFSSSNKNNLAERVKWAQSYAAKAKTLGIPCMLWDNNVISYTTNGESHGYLNRSSCTWYSESEAVVDALISTYEKTAVDLPEIVTVPDLSSAAVTVLSSSDQTCSGWSGTTGIRFDFQSMDKNGYIVAYYTASTAPTLILQNSSWKIWCKVNPTITENNVAYYSYSSIAEAYGAAYLNQYGSEPSSPLYDAIQLCFSAEGGSATINKIVYAIPPTVKNISGCTVTIAGTSAGYTGSAITPSVTVKDGTAALTNGTDYTLSYKNNVDAGTASVTITGKGNYTGSVTKNFTIAPRDVSNCTITLGSEQEYFRGTRIKPVVTVKIGSTVVSSADYSVGYTDNLTVGTAKITIVGKNNLSGTTIKNFEIVQRSIGNCDITLGAEEVVFNSVRRKPTVTVACNGVTLYSGNYKASYTNNLSVGTATITLTGQKNLKGTTVKCFKIVPRSIKNCEITLTKNASDPNKPDVTVKVGDVVLYYGNYTVSYSAVSGGKVTVTVTGKNNLKDTATLTYTVT